MTKIYRSHILVSIDPETILQGARGIFEKFKRKIDELNLSSEVKIAET